MLFHEIHIFRVREIEKLSLQLGGRKLVAILGENGSGKTTILVTLLFIMTGVVILKGDKSQMVRDVGEGDSWGTAVVEHNGRKFRIRRYFSSSDCELTYLDETPNRVVKKAVKVQAELDDMGLTADKILRAFMPQGQYGNLFNETDGNRLKLMFHIFRLTDTEEILKAVSAETSIIPLDQTVDEDLEEASKKLKAEREVFSQAQLQREVAKASLNSLHEASELLTKANQAAALQQERNLLQDRLTVVQKTIAKAEEEVKELKHSAESKNTALSLIRPSVAGWQGVLARHTIYVSEAAERVRRLELIETATTELQQFRSKLAELMAVQEPADYVQQMQAEEAEKTALKSEVTNVVGLMQTVEGAATKWRQLYERRQGCTVTDAAALQQMQAEVSKLSTDRGLLLQHIELGKSGLCPVCGQTKPNHDASSHLPLAEAQALLVGVEADLQAATQRLEAAESKNRDASKLDGELEASHSMSEMAKALLQKQRLLVDYPRASEENPINYAGRVTASLVDRLAALRYALSQAAAKSKEIAGLQTGISQRESAITSAEQYIKDSEARKVSDEEQASVSALLQAFQRSEDDYKADITKSDVASRGLREALANKAEIEKRLGALLAVPVSEVDADRLKWAEEQWAQRDIVNAAWAQASQQFGVAEKAVEIASASYDAIMVRFRVNEVNKVKHEVLDDLKWLLNVKSFPMYVASYYTKAINQMWANELALVDARFTCWQDERTLEFFVSFHESGKTRYVYQASGGERQLASVTYQLVINRLFATGIDWIAFDEPTTHVDDQYRPKMVSAFTRMQQRPELRSMQIIVVDHCHEFVSAVSDPIVLTKSKPGG